MKNKCFMKCVAVFLLGCLCLSACGSVDEQENSSVQKGDSENQLMKELQVEKHISETWTESLEDIVEEQDDNGEKSVTVSINGFGVVPNVDSMSVVEAEEFGLTSKNRKQLVQTLMDNEIYTYAGEDFPKERIQAELEQYKESSANAEEMLEQAAETGDVQDLKEEKKELANYKKHIKELEDKLKTAPEDYVKNKAEQFDFNYYWGKKDGIDYLLDFEKQNEEEDESRDYRLHFYPRHVNDVRPEGCSASDKLYYVPEASEIGSGVKKNTAKITMEEAREQVTEFVNRLGISNCLVERTAVDLQWKEKDQNQQGILSGYVFVLVPGVDGVSLSSPSIWDSGSYVTEERSELAEKYDIEYVGEKYPYSLYNELTVYVTDKGIIEVDWQSPIKITKVTKGVNILDYPHALSAMKSNIGEYMKGYYAIWKQMMGREKIEIMEFGRVSLGYYRVGQVLGSYSFIPVWRFEKSGIVSDESMVINALDGSYVNTWGNYKVVNK